MSSHITFNLRWNHLDGIRCFRKTHKSGRSFVYENISLKSTYSFVNAEIARSFSRKRRRLRHVTSHWKKGKFVSTFTASTESRVNRENFPNGVIKRKIVAKFTRTFRKMSQCTDVRILHGFSLQQSEWRAQRDSKDLLSSFDFGECQSPLLGRGQGEKKVVETWTELNVLLLNFKWWFFQLMRPSGELADGLEVAFPCRSLDENIKF